MQRFIRRFSLAFSVVVALIGSVRAQDSTPIPIEDVAYFEIHDENGDLGMTIEVTDLGNGEFELQAFNSRGEPFPHTSTATYLAEGIYIVQNGDSGNETTWFWDNGHYTKFGGTRHHREFHPVM